MGKWKGLLISKQFMRSNSTYLDTWVWNRLFRHRAEENISGEIDL
ncbi:hypothetical protein [Edaphobacter aggregans]|nr:hypothetical protein [Edaphobacter aggregans]